MTREKDTFYANNTLEPTVTWTLSLKYNTPPLSKDIYKHSQHIDI